MKTKTNDVAESSIDRAHLVEMTSDLVASYVANNPVSTAELPQLIGEVHKSLLSIADGAAAQSLKQEARKPAVPIKKSLHDDYIICLEDGQKFKSLKRHLSSHYGLSPQEYREKWGLPSDYPMVAPSYAKQRSHLAKKIGLGRRAGSQQQSKQAA